MDPAILLLLGIVLVGLGIAAVRWRKAAARAQAKALPFPAAWREILLRTFPLYTRLPEAEQERLHGQIQVFLAEKNLEGCGGLELTDEIRVSVAGQACLLLLNLAGTEHYAQLRSILIYPSTVVPIYAESQTHGSVVEEAGPVLGQSWTRGTVILAWDSVKRGATIPGDGRNLVFHEFAHQLDQEDGAADGVPYLDSASALRAWAGVMQEHYTALRSSVEGGRKTLLDEYGATNPAEFFAVATEYFFEKPQAVKRKHPELYAELADYYGQDPASWAPQT